MSLDYDLHMFRINGDLSRGEVSDALVRQFASDADPVTQDFDLEGVTVTVRPALRENQEEREFVHAGINTSFRIYSVEEDEYEMGMVNMIKLIDWLLTRFDVEADLSFDQDLGAVRLFKSRGRLVLVGGDFWTSSPPLRPYITQPYEYRRITKGYWLDFSDPERQLDPPDDTRNASLTACAKAPP